MAFNKKVTSDSETNESATNTVADLIAELQTWDAQGSIKRFSIVAEEPGGRTVELTYKRGLLPCPPSPPPTRRA